MTKKKQRETFQYFFAENECVVTAHADADYDEETARDTYYNPPAGHRSGPGGPTDA